MSKEHKEVYNDFVKALNKKNILIQSIKMGEGTSINDKPAVWFELETDTGFIDDEAKDIFSSFMKKHPEVNISYNLRERSFFEQELCKVAETVVVIRDGFKLETNK
jgi:hypothetical protein